MIDREKFLSVVREELEKRWHDVDGSKVFPQVQDDDNLFDVGILDSLALIEVISFVEQYSGTEFDLLAIDPAKVMTLNGLFELVNQPEQAPAE